MSQWPRWQDELDGILEGEAPYTRRRTARLLRGAEVDGDPVWEREEVRVADDRGHLHHFDSAWSWVGACGCVLTAQMPQMICARCQRPVCREHAVMCRSCRRYFCPPDSVQYGQGKETQTYCLDHRWIYRMNTYYLPTILVVLFVLLFVAAPIVLLIHLTRAH